MEKSKPKREKAFSPREESRMRWQLRDLLGGGRVEKPGTSWAMTSGRKRCAGDRQMRETPRINAASDPTLRFAVREPLSPLSAKGLPGLSTVERPSPPKPTDQGMGNGE